jgi:hypothetical protein
VSALSWTRRTHFQIVRTDMVHPWAMSVVCSLAITHCAAWDRPAGVGRAFCGRSLGSLVVAGCVSRQLQLALLRLSEQPLRHLQLADCLSSSMVALRKRHLWPQTQL